MVFPRFVTALPLLFIAIVLCGDAVAAPPQFGMIVAAQTFGASSHSPDDENAVDALIAEGRYSKAVERARDDLEAVKARDGTESGAAAVAMSRLAEALRLDGWPYRPETRQLAQESVRLGERQFGPNDPATAELSSTLGRVLMAVADYDAAEPPLERALRIREANVSDENSEARLAVSKCLADLGSLAHARGRYEEAKSLHERALSIREELLPPDHVEIARGLGNVAWVLQVMGRLDESERYLQRAVEIRAKSDQPMHPDTGWLLYLLAINRTEKGELEEALSIGKESWRIREECLGAEHPAVAASINLVAVILKRSDRLEEVIPLHERAIEIVEARLGPEHPHVLISLNNLSNAYQSLGLLRDALRIGERVLAIREKTLPSNHPDIGQSLRNNALVKYDLGMMAEFEADSRRALAIYESALGPEHTEIALLLSNLGHRLALAQGRDDEARQLLQRALAIYEKNGQTRHAGYADGLAAMAGLHENAGDLETARSLHEKALTIAREAFGETHTRIGYHLRTLALFTAVHGDFESASRYAREAERGRVEALRQRARFLPERHLLKSREGTDTMVHLLPTLAAASSPNDGGRLAEVWDSVIQSRSLVLDELSARNSAAFASTDSAGRSAFGRYASAQRSVAERMVAGPGVASGAEYRALLDSLRSEAEAAERTLAAMSAAFREELARSRAGFHEVAEALPDSSGLVAYVRYDSLHLESPDRDNGRPVGPASYLAFVLSEPDTSPRVVFLGSAAEIDTLVARWRDEAGRPIGKNRDVERERTCREAGNRLREAVWDPIDPLVGETRLTFIVSDGALGLVNFAALPVGDDAYLVEQGPTLHLLGAERDLVVEPDVEEASRLLALGDPDYDSAVETSAGMAASLSPEGRDTQTLAAFRGESPPCEQFDRLRWSRVAGTASEIEEIESLWMAAPAVELALVDKDSSLSGIERTALLLTRARASEEAFKAQAAHSHVLHVATHGFFLDGRCADDAAGSRGIGVLVGGYEDSGVANEDTAAAQAPGPSTDAESAGAATVVAASTAAARENPLHLSGLVLAGANRRETLSPDREDGIVTAEEIAALDLSDARWVVLSACETGVGDVRAGEGIFGLRRAFQTAGAKTLIMSLWAVQDISAREWIRALYEARWVRNLETAESVREANRRRLASLRLHGNSTHPFQWASFVALGDWR